MKILVVDDETPFLALLIEWFTDNGHEAIGLPGAKDVWTWVIRQRFDVVLLDIVLRDGNGLNLISRIKSLSPATAIVVMSGLREQAWIAEAKDKGATACLPKPFKLQQLAEILNEIAHSGLRNEPRANRVAAP